MIVLELSSGSPHLLGYDEFEVITEGQITALLLKKCVDDWVYNVDCARNILIESYDEFLQIFRDIIGKNANNLLAALLTPSPAEYMGKEILPLYEEDILANLYGVYISSKEALQSKILKKIIPLISTEKIVVWDASIPLELKMSGIESLEEVAENLEKLSFSVTRGYLHEGDLLAVRTGVRGHSS
ncbi:hypothetical protein [Candidatus Methanodesulfokora washburnensis]|uniref:Uncharacterized protein n=1 Tax=Candidatus Methanodesulfokora washburnensis TaxID=2478471 RepID=A0A3R9PGP2_9CREN|nr:hypothetical protein [Candidatus Methanodesulfokores washburnensis]RSN73933.1 hypothetical protein D6D85_09125 [Candidatus Methanodesulfokores washburnensis]